MTKQSMERSVQMTTQLMGRIALVARRPFDNLINLMNKKKIVLRQDWSDENNYVNHSYPIVQHAVNFLIDQMDDAILEFEIRPIKAKYAVRNAISLGFLSVKSTTM